MVVNINKSSVPMVSHHCDVMTLHETMLFDVFLYRSHPALIFFYLLFLIVFGTPSIQIPIMPTSILVIVQHMFLFIISCTVKQSFKQSRNVSQNFSKIFNYSTLFCNSENLLSLAFKIFQNMVSDCL